MESLAFQEASAAKELVFFCIFWMFCVDLLCQGSSHRILFISLRFLSSSIRVWVPSAFKSLSRFRVVRSQLCLRSHPLPVQWSGQVIHGRLPRHHGVMCVCVCVCVCKAQDLDLFVLTNVVGEYFTTVCPLLAVIVVCHHRKWKRKTLLGFQKRPLQRSCDFDWFWMMPLYLQIFCL